MAANATSQVLEEEAAANQEAEALRSEAAHLPALMELEFQHMMATLPVSHPTERELTDEEIASVLYYILKKPKERTYLYLFFYLLTKIP
ncbi:hypothetical protein FRC10_003226 [Ceratobasidium sp. 414]|nr:hypothetical protein FRC10_003226 [Ceratobasidium sp. 414]